MTKNNGNLKEIGNIYESTDYSKFNFITGNRLLNKSHVNDIKASMQVQNLLAPISVNENYGIIDGQHRFEAWKELGLPVTFFFAEGYNVAEIKMLNVNMKNWSKQDYLDAYCNLKYPEYIKFSELMKEYSGFGITIIETICMFGVNNKNYTRKTFEAGEFILHDIEKAREIANKLMSFKPLYKGYNKRSFVSVMFSAFKNEKYDHDKLIERVTKYPKSLHDCFNRSQYKDMIEEVYNRGLADKNRITLRG